MEAFSAYIEPRKVIKADYRDGKSMLLMDFRDRYLKKLPDDIISLVQKADCDNVWMEAFEDDTNGLHFATELAVEVSHPDKPIGHLTRERMESLSVPITVAEKWIRSLELPFRKAVAGVLIYNAAKNARRMARAGVRNGHLTTVEEFTDIRDDLLHDYYASLVLGNG